MGIGISNEAPQAPDTYGLPEFFITDVVTEIDGPNVRMVCGVRRMGKVHWLYSCVMPAHLLRGNARICISAADEASNLQQLIGLRTGH